MTSASRAVLPRTARLSAFAKFRELKSAKAVMRYLRRGGLALPVRPLVGPAPHELVWRSANSPRVLTILKNPAYAGVYVYGRRRADPGRRRAGGRKCGTVAVPPEDWAICLHDAIVAMSGGRSSWPIGSSWRTMSATTKPSGPVCRARAARSCRALSSAAAAVGTWGCATRARAETTLCTAAPPSDDRRATALPGSACLQVDAEVERLMLAALAPDRIALAVAALGEMEEEARLLERQWSLRRERARYEAERARRQYDAV